MAVLLQGEVSFSAESFRRERVLVRRLVQSSQALLGFFGSVGHEVARLLLRPAPVTADATRDRASSAHALAAAPSVI